MTKPWGSLGGRDDVVLAQNLTDVGRFAIEGTALMEADEIGGSGEFPYNGYFIEATVLDPDWTGPEEIYAQVTEGLQDLVDTALEESEERLITELTVDVSEAQKAGDEETSPWRYVASVVPRSQLGPPSEDDNGD